MNLVSWLRTSKSQLVRPLSSHRKHRRGRRNTRPASELLEPRTLLAAVMWDGGGGNLDWNNASNWSTDQLPGAGDDVTIDAPGEVTIEVSSDVAIHSLQTSDALTVSSGTFSISGDSQINAQFTNAGGTVSISGATVTGVGSFVNAAGSTVFAHASVINMALSNDGIWEVREQVYVNGPLTTGASSAIRILQWDSFNSNGNAALTVSDGFVNHGLIDLSSIARRGNNYSALVVQNGVLTNAADGTIRSSDPAGNGGRCSLTGSLDNRGLLDLSQYGLNWQNVRVRAPTAG